MDLSRSENALKPTSDNSHSACLFSAGNQNRYLVWVSYFLACILPAIFLWNLLSNLFELILTNETYSHIPLVPTVSAYLIIVEKHSVFSNLGRKWKYATAIALVGTATLVLSRWIPGTGTHLIKSRSSCWG